MSETFARLKAAVGEKGFTEDQKEIAPHLEEWRGKYQGKSPLLLKPASTAEVAAILAICNETKTAIVPQGGNTGLVGGQIPVHGEVLLSLQRMNRILNLDAKGMTMTVQSGTVLATVQSAAKEAEMLFPLSLASEGSCTIGGNIATNAGGTHVLRYGMMRSLVLGLEVVLADGRVLPMLTSLPKDNSGYDLKQMFIGSEGTLGVITEITLKLYPLPEAVMAATCAFSSLADAVNTTIQIIQLGVPIARCELLDGNTVRMVNQHSKLGLAEGPMMLMEFHGSPAGVQEQIATVQEIVKDNQGHGFQWADTPEERTRLWTARHNAYFAGIQSRPGCRCITTDTCVPISKLADALLDSVDEANAAGIPYFMVGHVGDGNFHMGYLIDPDNAQERATAEQLNAQLVARALHLGGTCTGEHGVGLHKMEFLVHEAGAGAVAMMRAIKQALDPHNILNPGKIFAL